jgi:hypothetical protein
VKYEKPLTRRLPRLSVLAACLAAVAIAAPRASAGQPETPRGSTARPARSTAIQGTAWNADSTPIPAARLRLRNATTGRIVAETVANGTGQFTFTNIEQGTYIVELVNESGKVLAVGDAFMVESGETVATFVRLSTHVPWFAGFFENAAGAATAAAAGLGVTALAPVAPPVSAKR